MEGERKDTWIHVIEKKIKSREETQGKLKAKRWPPSVDAEYSRRTDVPSEKWREHIKFHRHSLFPSSPCMQLSAELVSGTLEMKMPSSVGSNGFPAWPFAPPRMLMPSFSPGAFSMRISCDQDQTEIVDETLLVAGHILNTLKRTWIQPCTH